MTTPILDLRNYTKYSQQEHTKLNFCSLREDGVCKERDRNGYFTGIIGKEDQFRGLQEQSTFTIDSPYRGQFGNRR